MKTKFKTATLASGLTLLSLASWGRPISLPIPPPNDYADMERSTNVTVTGWSELTRFMNIRAEVFASLASCVQVAFGTDRSNDGALAVDETDLIVGYDCGTWFIRDERNCREWTDDASNLLSGDFIQHVFTARANQRYDGIPQANGMTFSRNWNLMKITTRGDLMLEPRLKLEFKNNPLVFVIR